MWLPYLKVSGGICRANPYSNQELHFWSQPIGKTLVLCDGKSFPEVAQTGFGKQQFRCLMCAIRKERTEIYRSRLGSTKLSVPFIVCTHFVIRSKINTLCC